MYAVNEVTELMMRQHFREWHVKVECNDVEYTSSQIVSFDIDSSIISGDDFELGAVIASQLKITLKSIELPSGAKIKPYVALSTDDLTWDTADVSWEDADFAWEGGTTEWIPLGEYYVEFREQINSRWEYTCTDKLIFANEPYISSLSYPVSMQAVWDEICMSLGYVSDSSVNIDPSLTVPIAPTGYIKREVMSYIASANSASVFVGKNGLIKFKKYKSSDAAVFDMTKADYVRAKQTNPQKIVKKLEVVVDDETKIDIGIAGPANTITFTNPLADYSTMIPVLIDLSDFKITPCDIQAKGYPHLEVGDIINLHKDVSSSWEDVNIAWQDYDVPWDGVIEETTPITSYTLSFRGGLSMSITSKAKSPQQSEIKVDGSITGQINKLSNVVVKQAKPYHGVTITKEDGLKIERSDGLFDALLNSDTFRFRAEGQDALLFDIPTKKFKFIDGRIEASEIITNPGQYPRVELLPNANVLTAYKTINSYYSIIADPDSYGSPIIIHTDGTTNLTSGIFNGSYFSNVNDGGYSIYASNDFRVTASSAVVSAPMTVNGDLDVTAGGVLTLGSTSHLLLGTQTLQSVLGNYVPYSTYGPQISSIGSRLMDIESRLTAGGL